jgi:hypothetical protein
MYQDMDLDICYEYRLGSSDSLNLQDILADNLRMGFHDILVCTHTRQMSFLCDNGHWIHMVTGSTDHLLAVVVMVALKT